MRRPAAVVGIGRTAAWHTAEARPARSAVEDELGTVGAKLFVARIGQAQVEPEIECAKRKTLDAACLGDLERIP